MSTVEGAGAIDPTLAVIAHALLSSVAVLTSAMQNLLSFGDDLLVAERHEILTVALTQAEYLNEVLGDIARGLPGEAIEALDNIAHGRTESLG